MTCEAHLSGGAELIAFLMIFLPIYRLMLAGLHPRVPFWHLWRWWPSYD